MANPMQFMKMLGNMQDPMQVINNLVQQNPQLSQYWNMAQQMTRGKTQEEIKTMADNLLKQRGMNMNQVSQMIQQFMGGKY